MLKATDLRLTFNPGTPIETQALRGMSLEIPTGQFVTVIGSNGAGKSTFLNAVSGEQKVDSGTIEIDGIDMTRQPVWGRARHVARVFQDPLAGTCEDLTIEENMALARCAVSAGVFRSRSSRRCARSSARRSPRWVSAWRIASRTVSACSPAASARR